MDQESELNEIKFTGESSCTKFRTHTWKPNVCAACKKPTLKHFSDAVCKADALKALEAVKKERIPSLILETEGKWGELYLSGFKTVFSKEFMPKCGAVLNVAGKEIYLGPKLQTDYENGIKMNSSVFLEFQWEDSEEFQIPMKAMEKSLQFIDKHRSQGKTVLVHCRSGKSRSVTVVIAYIMLRQQKKFEEALFIVQTRRPGVNPNPAFRKLLKTFHKTPTYKDLKRTFHSPPAPNKQT